MLRTEIEGGAVGDDNQLGRKARAAGHLAGDPVTILLLGYGRVDQWPGIAHGKLRAWGREPWLGPRFRKLLLEP